jgi:hypothetical protein
MVIVALVAPDDDYFIALPKPFGVELPETVSDEPHVPVFKCKTGARGWWSFGTVSFKRFLDDIPGRAGDLGCRYGDLPCLSRTTNTHLHARSI